MKNLKSAVTLSPAIAPFLLSFLLSAQPPAAPTPFPQRMQTLQQAAIQNEERLHTYQWIESTTVTMSGSPKPPKQSLCRYTAEGTLAKTPLGPQQQAPRPSGGPLRRHMIEKKIEEVQEEGAEVRSLVALYLPMRPAGLKQAFEKGRVDFELSEAVGNTVVINDYVKPGDQVALELDPVTMRLRRITVRTYFSSPREVLMASVDFSTLLDGTTYPSLTSIDAPSKRIAITTVNSNFSRVIP
jgi:hypothetical protein